jgi:hypothetical protein
VSRSASGADPVRIVRNLMRANGRPFSPGRSCLKSTGLPRSRQMRAAIPARKGDRTTRKSSETVMSRSLFASRPLCRSIVSVYSWKASPSGWNRFRGSHSLPDLRSRQTSASRAILSTSVKIRMAMCESTCDWRSGDKSCQPQPQAAGSSRSHGPQRS